MVPQFLDVHYWMFWLLQKIPVAVLWIVYCQGHLDDGNKKDGTFICNKFLNHMKEIDPAKTLSDIVMFYGASNVQLAGRFLRVHYPKLTVMQEFWIHSAIMFQLNFKDNHCKLNDFCP